MKSMLFHRIALSKDKEAVLKLSEKGSEIQNPLDIIKDPYVFEFLGLRNPITFSESELETSLVDNLQNFLLELGKGFAFIGRQYRITLSNRHFFVDLVFYHRILKCFVQIDLKKGEIGDQDIGQMKSIPKLLSKTRKY
jgi:predicted nuclease of restriction endonuclease-like (RecB) superfamily